jgi:hypothetical protein
MEGTPNTSDDPLIVTCTKCSGKVEPFLLCLCKWTDGPTIRDATASHFIGQLREDALRGLNEPSVLVTSMFFFFKKAV